MCALCHEDCFTSEVQVLGETGIATLNKNLVGENLEVCTQRLSEESDEL